ncbi:glycoside hydrolase family 5 protein [Saccharophagus degradans]|uniref:cellulase family glycosylhydrolase n=1 Tax=Saccharophagus degradans TaxID=86304 RepID=UPI001C085677|nr:cellulase family glycosylhydrolase [Saccharophagus degradans]MBU2983838.1 glycoside hydrolase family 5 protein [Saccharophagus degradans]
MRATLNKWLQLATLLALTAPAFAMQAKVSDGVLTWENGEEVALFGVNYSAPFAFTYRSIAQVGADHKQAILMDIDHFERMGAQAYRVHLWDRELADLKGNLLDNKHLDLFDFLLAELAKRDIKVIITMMSWWGTGYPEPDPQEPGFATQFTKEEMNQKAEAITAQLNYIKQLVNHTNRYTNKNYANDENIIAFELFNEPKHKISPAKSAAYIQQLIDAARTAGVKKPLFYNISEQGNDQAFAKALCSTDINGVAFQWYPTGLVKYSTIQANMLANVAHYTNPFAQTQGCANKAKMIYEFDAADVNNSTMYPAMARSFREAGFQWATLFSYDPGHVAHTNAEYNTHYLNLLYTPEKALGFRIAREVFTTQPRLQQTGPYPANNSFGATELNFHKNLAVFNSDTTFLYSNNTEKTPKNPKKLVSIAGVGSSPIVNYNGSGAYFLDKVEPGIWRLEVYPDNQVIQDPYQNSSLRREVGRLYLNRNAMDITLPDLGKNFVVTPLTKSRINYLPQTAYTASKNTIAVEPGIYLLSAKNTNTEKALTTQDSAYYLPPIQSSKTTLYHLPQRAISVNDNYIFSAKIGTSSSVEKVELVIRYKSWRDFHSIAMQPDGKGNYSTKLPNDAMWQKPGPLEYAIAVTQAAGTTTFPGGVEGNPKDWNFVAEDGYWKMDLQPTGVPIDLFDAKLDENNLIYPKDGRTQQNYTNGQFGKGSALSLGLYDLEPNNINALSKVTLTKNNALHYRDTKGYNTLLIKIRATNQAEQLSIGVLDEHGLAYTHTLTIGTKWQYMMLPLSDLRSGITIFGQAYPMFLPSTLEASNNKAWQGKTELIQGLQFYFDSSAYAKNDLKGWHEVQIENIALIQQ